MADPLNKFAEFLGGGPVLKFIEHNRFAFASVIVTLGLAAYSFGMAPKVHSPFDDDVMINREQLVSKTAAFEAEVGAMANKIVAADESLANKEAKVNEILSMVSGLILPVAGPWGGLAGAGLMLAFGGMGLDNVRKSKLIKDQKAKQSA